MSKVEAGYDDSIGGLAAFTGAETSRHAQRGRQAAPLFQKMGRSPILELDGRGQQMGAGEKLGTRQARQSRRIEKHGRGVPGLCRASRIGQTQAADTVVYQGKSCAERLMKRAGED